MEREKYVALFDGAIRQLFKDALRISFRDPGMALFLLGAIRRQNRAARLRQSWAAKGVRVPPFMIMSITDRCNLHCKGCYAQAHRRSPAQEMSDAKLEGVIAEARDLGVSIMLIAGGEPLTRPEILDIAGKFPEIVFPVFTNGLLLDDEKIAAFRRQRNVIPVVSLEGEARDTDSRRGGGVHKQLLGTVAALRKEGVFFGASFTLTRNNCDRVVERGFIGRLIAAGCRLFFFVDYVPVQEGTEEMVMTEAQRKDAAGGIEALRSGLPGLFIALPGDEERYGGCLAAGRGFAHISPEGGLEPCPFSPHSDANLHELSLREALQSDLLRKIRENAEQLSETRGGCALWTRREWVRSLLAGERE
ncbi:MAG: radical SAM/SPASM domain-containing protein [Bacteroidota bacterium]